MALRYAEAVVDGCFYSFVYEAKSTAQDVDLSPFIFCIRPSTISINNFVGLNLHQLPLKLRMQLIYGMQKKKNILKVGRATFTEEELNKIVPGCKAAVREYNRKRVFNCIQVDSSDVPYYIHTNGRIVEENKSPKFMEFLLKNGAINKL